MPTELPDLAAYAAEARRWLAAHAEPRSVDGEIEMPWGIGSDDVSVFHNLNHEAEAEVLERGMAWQRTKFDGGYGAITWPVAQGGSGLPPAYERAFRTEESAFVTPTGHETLGVTIGLVAPTIASFGTEEQQARFLPHFLRTDELCCQLFSEPVAGSDLAGLATRAVKDGETWIINGQKVWSSGAQYSAWGELISRSDPDVEKHAGLTAFLVPMDSPGVEVRPIRQMSGGSSFNEVFFTDVRVPDTLRLGEIGAGWKVALTTLGFERAGSGSGRSMGGSWRQVVALARWLDRTGDPLVRQQLSTLYAHHRVAQFNALRVAGRTSAGGVPGPEGSIGKLHWTRGMTHMGEVVAQLLGPRITADTGEWGTYAWTNHFLGAPGYRVAGGSDEIQHNIIGERVLGLPGEPRVDRNVAWRDVPR